MTFSSDTRAKIPSAEEALKNIGCGEIAAFVIYDLPGRDCAAKASNGELAVGQLDVYKSQYIDRESPLLSLLDLFTNTNSHRRHLQEIP